MAKLIIEINDGEAGNIKGIQVDMKLEVSKESQRTFSDAVVANLASCMKYILPEITKDMVELTGRKVTNTELKQDQTLSEVLAAAQRKAH